MHAQDRTTASCFEDLRSKGFHVAVAHCTDTDGAPIDTGTNPGAGNSDPYGNFDMNFNVSTCIVALCCPTRARGR